MSDDGGHPAHSTADTGAGATIDPARVDRLVREQFPELVATLHALVAVPSVSAAPDQGPVARSAHWVADLLRGAGLPEVEVLRAPRPDGLPGAPAVLARRPAPPGAPTVLLYAHHDVQPPGEASAWTSPPFTATERDGRLYGRGAADDKAGICVHLAAVRTHLALHGPDGGVGITVLVEGEEEVGSPSLAALLGEQADRLRADVVVVADSTNAAVGVPALTTTLRGLMQCTVEVATLDHALHSGMYGGAAPDARAILLRLLASLWHDDGTVAVPGLGELPTDARPATAAQQAWPAARLRAEAGVLDGVRLAGEPAEAINEPAADAGPRVWGGPAITVTGIDGPSVAEASNTLHPTARALLSVRVPPGADPAAGFEALRRWLLSRPAQGARVNLRLNESGHGFAVRSDTPSYEAATWALREAWGTEPETIGVGGSIPFVADLARLLPAATILVTGVEDPDSRAHGIDESVHLGELARACVAEALLLERLAAG